MFSFELMIIPLLFLTVQHVHAQPAVTNASSTKLIPNKAPRADVALDELALWPGIHAPGWIQEPVPKAGDVVKALVLSGGVAS